MAVRGDANDGVARVENLRVGNGFHPHVFLAKPTKSFHKYFLRRLDRVLDCGAFVHRRALRLGGVHHANEWRAAAGRLAFRSWEFRQLPSIV